VTQDKRRTFILGEFEIDVARMELRRSGTVVPLQLKPFQMLAYMAERGGSRISKQELLDSVWGDVVVSDTALSSALKDIRKALGDDGTSQRWIQTQRNRGYRLVVADHPASAPDPARDARVASSQAPESWMHRSRLPFQGRDEELRRLQRCWTQALDSKGGIALVGGEPGIGKSRLLEELAAVARSGCARVLTARAFEGDDCSPYAFFAQALEPALADDSLAELASTRSRHPLVFERLAMAATHAAAAPGAATASADPNEARYQLCCALGDLATTLASERPLLILADDLQWCDPDTLAVVRYLARLAARIRLLIVASYRDTDARARTDLSATIAALRRETSCECMLLGTLPPQASEAIVRALWPQTLSPQTLPPALCKKLVTTSGGHPFFLREILLNLLEKHACADDAAVASLADPEHESQALIPLTIRYTLQQRMERLSSDARQTLAVGACFSGPFPFEAVVAAAKLETDPALAALDELLRAQLLRASPAADVYEFGHGLIGQFVYTEMSPSRRIRLHRQLAQALEQQPHCAELAGQIGQQYLRSRPLPGAEQGVPHCEQAAERAERRATYSDAALHWNAALQLLPAGDSRTSRIQARLAVAIAWNGDADAAVRAASQASARLLETGDVETAVALLADAADAVWRTGSDPRACDLAELALPHLGGRRDLVWARLMIHRMRRDSWELHRETGLQLDHPAQREVSRLLLAQPEALLSFTHYWRYGIFATREEILRWPGSTTIPFYLAFFAGEYRRGLECYRTQQNRERGPTFLYAELLSHAAILESALGDLCAAAATIAKLETLLAAHVDASVFARALLLIARARLAQVVGERTELQLAGLQAFLEGLEGADYVFAAPARAAAATATALLGQRDGALRYLALTRSALERGEGWNGYYLNAASGVCEAYWELDVTPEYPLETHIQKKILDPDFRNPHCDGRLNMARLLAQKRQVDAAVVWFEAARRVLDEQGAQPLRAVVDLDEARMYARRGARGDRTRALALLDLAEPQMRRIGMTGWLTRTAALRAALR